MLELTGINWWAVAAVWIVYCAIGAWWYSPGGFAKQWTKLSGVNIMKIPEQQATRIIMYVALSALVQVLALAAVLHSLDAKTLTDAVLVGLVTWLGFTAATTVGTTLYSLRSWKFWWLNSSYFLVVMLLGSVILTVWQ